jgi:hypothetical protein
MLHLLRRSRCGALAWTVGAPAPTTDQADQMDRPLHPTRGLPTM